MSGHTKEPWHVFSLSGTLEIKNEHGNAIIHWKGFDSSRAIEDPEDNARRIVACVNACAGIPTETLESGKTVAEALKWSGADVLQQRDALAIAAKAAIDMLIRQKWHPHDTFNPEAVVLRGLMDAVAKVHGWDKCPACHGTGDTGSGYFDCGDCGAAEYFGRPGGGK